MSSLELERVEVMGRVASGALKLVHAAEMLALSQQLRQCHSLDYALTLRPNGLRFRAQSTQQLEKGTFLMS